MAHAEHARILRVAMKIVAENRRARFDYELQETLEAGIVLTGSEAKSCRAGGVHLQGSYVSLHGGRLVLRGMTIAPYRYAADLPSYDPQRDRPLLLRRGEIAKIAATLSEKGLTVVPLAVRAGRHIKIVLGIGRGRKRQDKRHRIRERETARGVREGRDV